MPEELTESELPLIAVVDHEAQPAATATWWRFRFAALIPFGMLCFLTGGVVGLYVQPPGLQRTMRALDLEPGAGSSDPMAVPVAVAQAQRAALQAGPDEVQGLGRLTPNGDVLSLAPPYGSGDARVQTLAAKVGDRVRAGAIVAILDNEGTLQRGLESARSTQHVREATLRQTRASVRASRAEAQASLARAQSALGVAQREFERGETLLARTAISTSSFERLQADAVQARREVDRSQASLGRYAGAIDDQPDVVVAEANLRAATSEVNRAEQDLEKAYIRAPIDGTVLDIHTRPGERPSTTSGVVDLGDLDAMKAEVEVYQSQIGAIRVGQRVRLVADAFNEPLSGEVSSIGLEVGRQTLVGDGPAANTDARVIDVTIDLDPPSSTRAASFTNLQVVATIDVKTP